MLHFESKLGKGGAVLKGLRAARFEYIGYLDADGPITARDLTQLLDGLVSVDCTIASRFVPGSHVLNREPLRRRLAGAIWSGLVRGIMFLPVLDTQCGAKFFRRDSIRPTLDKVVLTNWAFDVSLLYYLHQSGATISEVPVSWSHDPASHLVVSRAGPIMLLSLIGLRFSTLPFPRLVPGNLLLIFARRFRFGRS